MFKLIFRLGWKDEKFRHIVSTPHVSAKTFMQILAYSLPTSTDSIEPERLWNHMNTKSLQRLQCERVRNQHPVQLMLQTQLPLKLRGLTECLKSKNYMECAVVQTQISMGQTVLSKQLNTALFEAVEIKHQVRDIMRTVKKIFWFIMKMWWDKLEYVGLPQSR